MMSRVQKLALSRAGDIGWRGIRRIHMLQKREPRHWACDRADSESTAHAIIPYRRQEHLGLTV